MQKVCFSGFMFRSVRFSDFIFAVWEKKKPSKDRQDGESSFQPFLLVVIVFSSGEMVLLKMSFQKIPLFMQIRD